MNKNGKIKMNTKNKRELHTILESHAYAPELNKLRIDNRLISCAGATTVSSAKTIVRKKLKEYFATPIKELAVELENGSTYSLRGFKGWTWKEQARQLRKIYGEHGIKKFCTVYVRY